MDLSPFLAPFLASQPSLLVHRRPTGHQPLGQVWVFPLQRPRLEQPDGLPLGPGDVVIGLRLGHGLGAIHRILAALPFQFLQSRLDPVGNFHVAAASEDRAKGG